MADVSEVLKKMNLISKDSADSIRSVEEIIGGISAMISYAGVVKSILDKCGFFPKEDMLAKKLDEILDKFNEVLDLLEIGTKISDDLDKARTIATVMGPVRTSMILLQAYLLDENSSNINTKEIFSDPLNAAVTLAGNAFWRGIYAEELAYDMENYALRHDPCYWTYKAKPPDASGKISAVFDYKQTLPAFLEAITARLAMLVALEPGFRSNEAYRRELLDYSDKLIEVHNRIIQNGIIPLNGPGEYALFCSYTDEKTPSGNVCYVISWRKNGCKYGVVDLYSTTTKVSNYPLPFFLELENPPPNFQALSSDYIILNNDGNVLILIPIGKLDTCDLAYWFGLYGVSELYWDACDSVRFFFEVVFKPKIIIRTIKLWQDLYSELGLPEVWRTINHLRWLAGYDPLELPDIPCTTISLKESYFIELFKLFKFYQCIRRSLRNIYSIYNIVKIRASFILAYKYPDPTSINGILKAISVSISMREIASELYVLPPISLSRLYED
ncbi:MAG TPA: hypothetical protein PK105_07995 [Rectinema sp.]|nr:hypothetical protein [Rectinema sp.]